MQGPVYEGPYFARRLGFALAGLEQPGTDSKQDAAPPLQPFSLPIVPWKGIEQWQPRILELRQLFPGYSLRQKLARHGPQSRLCGCFGTGVQLLEPLAPPGESDRSEPRIARRRHDVGKGEIEVPQCREGGPQLPRQLLDRNLPIGTEPPFSDR